MSKLEQALDNTLNVTLDIEPQELSDDIEVIGPGQMLADGRKVLGLSQLDVATKLNFRLTLVKDIESEKFDKNLPETFNRGYLRNFAKLVNISEKDVLASYEMLDIAEKQGAEMQSFSKITKRQAEHSRIMWVTYLVVALIIGSTVLWLFQDDPSSLTTQQSTTETTETIVDDTGSGEQTVVANADVDSAGSALQDKAQDNVTDDSSLNNMVADSDGTFNAGGINSTTADIAQTIIAQNISQTSQTIEPAQAAQVTEEASAPVKSSVTFFFKGDCWVNIYDSTGERIAWGVKKSDYVMNITGVAPFTVTLGRPELVTINFNGSDIDMTQFTSGNIAKFNLPVTH